MVHKNRKSEELHVAVLDVLILMLQASPLAGRPFFHWEKEMQFLIKK
jgi:hypothetical protein